MEVERLMANNICVFCGQKPRFLQDTLISCADTQLNACKTCEKELQGLEELEICRRALIRGLTENPDRLQKRIELITEAENHRPKCLQCGEKLTFMKVQELDNSPMQDSLFKDPFEVLPAYCKSCGKFEFYKPSIVQKNKYLVYLINKDA